MLVILFGVSVIGFSFGILGLGGFILIVLLLIYVIGWLLKVVIVEFLLIVGCIVVIGVMRLYCEGLIDWLKVGWFGLLSMVGIYLGVMIL